MFKSHRSDFCSVLVASALLSACGSGGSDAPAPVKPSLSVATEVSVKEKAATIVTASGSSGAFSWTQLSGPQLQLSGNNSAALNITAPAVEADTSATLQVTLTNSDNQSSNQNVIVLIKNNQLPKLTVNFSPVSEKAQAELKIQATDPDGSIKSYQWEQTDGPVMKLSGTTTDSIRFLTPAINANTKASFRITVTDNDDESLVFEQSITIQQLLQTINLSGRLTDPVLANATVKAVIAGNEFISSANSAGVFSMAVTADDDETNLLTLLTATKAGANNLSYYTLLPNPLSATTDQPLTVDAWSTAWYAALVQANNYKSPTDLATVISAERKALVGSFAETAAVASLLINNKAVLPATSGNLLSVLTTKPEYIAVIDKIAVDNPGLLQDTVDTLLSDTSLLPTMGYRSYFWEIAAAMPGFVAGDARSYAFSDLGTGSYLDRAFVKHFKWKFQWNKLLLDWQDFSFKTFESVVPGLMGLTAEQTQHLRNWNMTSIEVQKTYQNSELQHLVRGQSRDVYHIADSYLQSMQSVSVPGLVIPQQEQLVTKSRQVLVAKPAAQPLMFTQAEMTGEWAFIRYIKQGFNSVDNYYLDPLTFNADGTGVSSNTKLAFRWGVYGEGTLVVDFADGSEMQIDKIEKLGEIYQIRILFIDAGQNPMHSIMTYAFPISATDAQQTSIANSPDSYWQQMSSLATPARWDGLKLPVIAPDNSENIRGLQYRANNTGNTFSSGGPAFSPQLFTKFNWKLAQDQHGRQIIRSEGQWSCKSSEVCFVREWRILKVVPGIINQRVYIEENLWLRFDGTAEFEHLTGPSLTMFEEIPYSYFNKTP